MTPASAPIYACQRHRINLDGDGVVSLVAFYGCPLRCQYCFNRGTWQTPPDSRWRTPEELYEALKKDALYFLVTNGGVTFGGGEPMLRADFIRRFRALCGPHWKIRVETSLCCDVESLAMLLPYVDEWIVDIKSTDSSVYKRYTACDSSRRDACLQYLVKQQVQERCVLRLPVIPDFTTAEDQQRDMAVLREMGFTRFDRFDYVIPK